MREKAGANARRVASVRVKTEGLPYSLGTGGLSSDLRNFAPSRHSCFFNAVV